MDIVDGLGSEEFYARLTSVGVALRFGPFAAKIRADADALRPDLFRMYRYYPLLPEDSVFSFHIRLDQRRNWLPGNRQRVRFSVDGQVPHEDMPASQALAVLEWGINLVVAMRAHHLLMLHAAVLERDGKALLMPAEPGFGKTTLCAALAHRGWRLLSDEFGLMCPDRYCLLSAPRPMPLKNESIEVIRQYAPNATIGGVITNTRKGDVAHVCPPADSVLRMNESAKPALIVFPRWRAGEECHADQAEPLETFMRLVTNSFNYELLGETAFRGVASLVDNAPGYRLAYSNLDDAVATIDELVGSLDA